MKINLGLFVTLIFLIVISSGAQAHEFNTTDGRGRLLFPETAFSEPLDAKISCKPDGSHCLMLVYQNNTFFGRGVNVWFSTNFFNVGLGTAQITNIAIDFSTYYLGFYDNYHLPYDVTYTNGKYYIFVANTVYSYDGITFSTIGSIDDGSARPDGRRLGLGFINDTYIRTFESIVAVNDDNKVISKLKGTALSNAFAVNAEWSDGTGNPTLRYSTNLYDGSGAGGIPSIPGCGGTGLTSCNGTFGLGSFPTDFTGLDHYVNELATYQRYSNSTWRVSTSDFSTFGTPALIYSWDSSINETINNSDSSLLYTRQIYVYTRDSSNSALNGIWVYNLPLTEIRMLGEGFDPARRTTEIVNLTLDLNCSDENWQDSGTGQDARVQTPCSSGNDILITSFVYKPTTYQINDLAIPTNCIGLSNIIRTATTQGYYKPYNYTITFIDSIFGNKISGVSGILNSDTETTGSDGQAVYEVFPINNENFTVSQDNASCTTLLTFTGSSKPFVLTATKSGYESYSESFNIAEPPFDVETDFDTSKTVFMSPINTEVEVHIYSSDGVEIFPSQVSISIFGSNSTYWRLNSQLFNTNTATNAPAEFILINNTGTFNVTVSVNYFGQFNVSANVTTSEFKRIDVFTNYSSMSLPCVTLSDCTTDLCNGQYYRKLKTCESSTCTYDIFDCGSSVLCDQNLGCVDIVSITNCTRDSQCSNICLDNYTMSNNLCGYDGFCKGKTVECAESCNSTLGYCQELAQCVLRSEKVFSAGFINPTTGGFIGGKVNAFCDFSNAKKYTCGFPDNLFIRKADLDRFGLTIQNDVVVDPNGWPAKAVTSPEDGYELFAVSVYCTEYCNLTYEFCENGCDQNTGRCRGIAKTIDDTLGVGTGVNNLVGGWWGFYNAMLPDINARSFMWLVYGILILIFINALTLQALPKIANIHVTIGKEVDIIVLLAWIFIGSIGGQFYSFVWIVLTVLAAVYIGIFVVNKQTGTGGG